MRPSKTRSRGSKNRNIRPTGGNIINRVFESSGPEGKVRGTPQQVIEKYLQLHRDAQLSGDRVNAENYAQHAEHYTRMLAEAMREVERAREEQEEFNRQRQAERDRSRGQRDGQGDDRGDSRGDARGEDRGDSDTAEGASESAQVDVPEGKPAFLDARSREGRRPRTARQAQKDDTPAGDAGQEGAAEQTPAGDRPARAPRAPRTRKPRSSGNPDSSSAGDDAPETIQPDIAS